MSSLTGRLARAARAFFLEDLTVQRQGGRLRVGFAGSDAQAESRPPSRAELQAQRRQAEVERMRVDLRGLFESEPGLERRARHLALFGTALAERGLAALERVPLELLRQAHAELESEVMNWSAEGLACLRSKMAVALHARSGREDASDPGDTSSPPAVGEAPAQLAARVLDAAQRGDEHALAAAYAALGVLPPAELSSPRPQAQSFDVV